MGKLVVILSVVGAMGCAAGSSPGQAAPKRDVYDSPRTRTSTASISGGLKTSPTIRVRVGVVRVVHSVSGQARLRGTRLQGLDDHNRGVEYAWAENGEYRVEVSGRYRHSVLGAIVGNARLVSTVTYEELPDGDAFSQSVSGFYRLVSIDGNPLPYSQTITADEVSAERTMIAGSITLNENGTFSWSNEMEIVSDVYTGEQKFTLSGTFTLVEPATLQLTNEFGDQFAGTLDGDRLTLIEIEGGTRATFVRESYDDV